MQVYRDINHDSGVRGYDIGDADITVWFNGTAKSYTYSYANAGAENVEAIKRLAENGDGLNAFIKKIVNSKYVR